MIAAGLLPPSKNYPNVADALIDLIKKKIAGQLAARAAQYKELAGKTARQNNRHFSSRGPTGIFVLWAMKSRIKVNFFAGKVEAENCPIAFQIFLVILVAAVFLAVVYKFQGAVVIPVIDKIVHSTHLKPAKTPAMIAPGVAY